MEIVYPADLKGAQARKAYKLTLLNNNADPHTQHLAESLALLELEFVEFREHILARLSESSSVQQLRDDVTQVKGEFRLAIKELRAEVTELQQDNQALRAQLAKIKEDTLQRERAFTRELQDLREQLREHATTPCSTNTDTHCTPPQNTVPPPDTDTQHLFALPEHSDTTTLPVTQESQTHPTDTPAVSNTQPCPDTQPPSDTQSPSSNRAEKPKPQVVLLMDSNGKFLEAKRLFPGQEVQAIRCSNTGRAMELLKREKLGNPSCIVVHTGTNDLCNMHHRTASAVWKVAERAAQLFPDSRVVMSTLLPRADTPPHILQEINSEIARGCATLPNVHLAHHSTIHSWHLYDGLHLNQEGVKIFAKTLKDAALGRNHRLYKNMDKATVTSVVYAIRLMSLFD
ncbi:hypothetical protein SKAU_G00116270 [Synaphobranchus kaupii]|uniref:Uncharacterized protein n=1 Tax=Synaphobranchus kaupii TaxID=118154 RepID=A0A9Q1J1K6_SYNKA|nr:hypothetical protein SKAU_G00116270 [Synaphobranchus kaupii]